MQRAPASDLTVRPGQYLVRPGQSDRDALGAAGQREAQRGQLVAQDGERGTLARRRQRFPGHQRVQQVDPSSDVVALEREQLAQQVRGAVGFQRPRLHLTNPLAPTAALPAHRLLRDGRVAAALHRHGAGLDLLLDQMMQLHQVGHADGDRLLIGLAALAVVEHGLAALRPAGRAQVGPPARLRELCERGQRDAVPQRRRGQAQVGLTQLPDVHALGYANAVQDNVHWCTVGQERHAFARQDARHHALVPVSAGHLITLDQLAQRGDGHGDAAQRCGRVKVHALRARPLHAHGGDTARGAMGQA